MVKINILGDIFGASGYSNHTRNLMNALYEFTQDIYIECGRPAGWEVLCNDAERNILANQWFNDGVTIFIGMPQFWKLALNEPQKAFYGFVVWEGDKVPKSWIEDMIDERVTGILVPSEHVKKAILNTLQESWTDYIIDEKNDKYLIDKIHIIPHGADPNKFVEQPKPDIFTFVANKGWAKGINDRGGIQWLLKAFSEEFKKDEQVQLKIKINPVYCYPGWNIQNEINNLQLNPDSPPIHIGIDLLDLKYLPTVYQGHCFVSPTMGEAFNIPCVEAMSCGLPVITTDFGGQTDFVNEEIGWIIKTTPWEVKFDTMYEGINWGMPNMAELRKAMRYAFEHKEECLKMGEKAREKVINSWTWKHSAEKLYNLVK